MINKENRDNKVYSVYEVAIIAKSVLEELFPYPYIWIEGEISNFKHHPSGHLYFSLKDEKAQINAVMFKSKASKLTFNPENGMKVRVRGYLSLYEKTGNFQIYVEEMKVAGIGDLLLALEELKKKLSAEGLFDSDHKKEIPFFPERVGVVTAKSGAAVRDIVRVIKRRAPMVQVIVRDTLVQGKEAASDIVEAIREFNDYGKVDVLIVGRGGGSIEDLWAFNEEIVVRAIYESVIPIISAVGHEIDYTLSDFVADRRAPTPSAAAEIAVPNVKDLKNKVILIKANLLNTMNAKIKNLKKELDKKASSRQLTRAKDVLSTHYMRVDHIYDKIMSVSRHRLLDNGRKLGGYEDRIYRFSPLHKIEISKERLKNLKRFINNNIDGKIKKSKDKLDMIDRNIKNLSPKNVLKRGYSIVWDKEKVVKSVKELALFDRVILELKDGKREVTVTRTKLHGGRNA